jgi:hypothetical protein
MDFFKVVFMPDIDLIFWASVLIILDLLTGMIKAHINGDLVISAGIRKTAIKLSQYMGAIAVCFVLSNVAASSKDTSFFGNGMYDKLKFTFQFLNNLVMFMIIYIESISVLENGLDINGDSLFSKFFVRPLHRLLSLAILVNAIKVLSDRTPKPKG